LCEHPIFNQDEENLLKATEKNQIIHILKNVHLYNINVKNVFNFLTTHSLEKKYTNHIEIMYKYCDFTDLLANNLHDKTLVKEIVKKGKVNWFRTYCGGKTFLELAYDKTNDKEIIDLIYEKLPLTIPLRPTEFPYETPDETRPVVSPIPPPVPPRTYRKHRRSDSLSNNVIYPTMERNATIRRSLRSSLYPSLNGGFDPDIYPDTVTFSLYPILPSAPSFELM
jgi:hypothetical protein